MKDYIARLLNDSVSVEIGIAIITIISSLLITKWTISSERRKMVSELQRNAYMAMLTLITKIRDNPTLVFSREIIDQLKMNYVAVDVYGKKSIADNTNNFIKLANEKYYEYSKRFESEDDSIRSEMKKSWMYSDMLDREEEDYMIQNLPSISEIEQLAESLKKEITASLRKG